MTWRPRRAVKRSLYRGGRPGRIARALNALSAWQFAHGILTLGGRGVSLEVRGRLSGRPVRLPLVLVRDGGARYLVSMLGRNANWVRNVQADHARARLLGPRGREAVRLVQVPANQRAALLRRYLDLAPGARPHLPVPRRAPLAQFEAVAADFPVFRVIPLALDDDVEARPWPHTPRWPLSTRRWHKLHARTTLLSHPIQNPSTEG